MHSLYLARLAHLRIHMRAHDVPVLLEVDPSHIFYATGARNMLLWTMRSPARYVLICADGPVILYEFNGSEHLARDLPTVDDIRPAEGLDLITSGADVHGASCRFAAEIESVVREHDTALDRLGPMCVGCFPPNSVSG